MATPENQNQNTNLNADPTTDVTRSQNREGAAASNEDNDPMGTASEDTGNRPSNSDKGNQQAANNHLNETGSHREGQYPRNGESTGGHQEVHGAPHAHKAEGQVGKPGDKPE